MVAQILALLVVVLVGCSNNSSMDLFGLYKEVIKWGGMMLNESYDHAGRYTGAINFSGQIFPNLKNYTPNHRATSIGEFHS